MKKKLIIACIISLFSIEMFGQAVISKAAENTLQTSTSSPSFSNTPEATGTSSSSPISTGTVSDTLPCAKEDFEYNVKQDATHKYIELTYYIGNKPSVIIPDNIDGIPVEVLKSGLFVFNKCDIYEVTVPKSVKLIEYRAFDGTVNERLFYGSASLRNIKILGKDTKIEKDAFYYCGRLEKIEADNEVFNNLELSNLDSYNLNPFLINNIKDGLIILGDKLFYDRHKNGSVDCGSNICSYTRKRIVPDGVKIIGKDAFKDSNYRVIVIPNSVEKIEKGAFKNCKIDKIYIPTNAVVEEGAFDSTVKIYRMDEKTVNENDLNYSYNDKGVLNGYFGNEKVVQIPSEINGTKITSIAGNELVGVKSFYGNYYYEQSVVSYYCGAEKVVIPEGVTEINDYAFYCCYTLKEVVIPSTVTKISKNAFLHCGNLIKITTSNKNIVTDCEEYNNALANDGKEKVDSNIFNGYKYWEVFDNAEKKICIYGYTGNEKKLTIPDKINGLDVIEVVGFSENSSIEEVVIPETVKSLYGFTNCPSLKKVTINGKPEINGFTFANTPYLEDIYKNNNGIFIYNGKIISVSKEIDKLVVPSTVKEIAEANLVCGMINNFSNIKEIDLSSDTKVLFGTSSTDTPKECKSLDDYRQLAVIMQKVNDYYFTLKLDDKVVWSNEVATDTPEKIRPNRVAIEKPSNTADFSKIALLMMVLPISGVALLKLKRKSFL